MELINSTAVVHEAIIYDPYIHYALPHDSIMVYYHVL